MTTHRTSSALLATACLLATSAASAVGVAAGGTGGALIVPYYTVDNGNSTIVTIANSSSLAKAVKLSIREGANGRPVLTFNLYLGARDQWSAVITALDPNGAAILSTTDASCTVPDIRGNASLPSLPSGARYVPFRNFAYSGDVDDGAGTSLARTRQGSLEVIEMATLGGGSAAATATATRDCGRLVQAWSQGGYWFANPTVDATAPGGTLSATADIIDVAKGAAFPVPVVALEAFRAGDGLTLHAAPGGDAPSLGDATGGIDAVSAVLTQAAILNDFSVEPGLAAQTEWVVTFPTKRYHTDSGLVGTTARAPFVQPTGTTAAQFAASCIAARIDTFGTDGAQCSGAQCDVGPICGTVSIVRFSGPSPAVPIFGGTRIATVAANALGAQRGIAELEFRRADGQPFEASYLGQVRRGLPVVGFSGSLFTNAQAQPGVLATYARTTPHRTGE